LTKTYILYCFWSKSDELKFGYFNLYTILAVFIDYRGKWGTFGQEALMYGSKFDENYGFKNLVKIKRVYFEVNISSNRRFSCPTKK
jgi:hypothetical protein